MATDARGSQRPGEVAPGRVTTTTSKRTVHEPTEESRPLLPEGWLQQVRDVVLLRPAPGTLRGELRAQVHPWRWGAAVATAGVCQHLAFLETPSSLVSTLAVAGVAVLAARWMRRWIAKYGRTRFDLAHDWVAREPGHARMCGWAAAGWLALLHGVDPASAQTWALITGTLGIPAFAAVSARFWRHHRPELMLEAPEPTPPQEGEHSLARTWRRYVGASNKALPNSRLKSVRRDGVFHEALLHLDRGRHHLEMVRTALPQIASGMGISASSIVVEEREPTEADPEPDPAILNIRFLSSGLATRAVALQGRRYVHDGERGLVRLGAYLDGEGEPTVRMYSEDSMWGGYAVGATGSGKSAFLDNLALAAWQSGTTVVFYIDGAKDGGSSPRIFDRADWPLGNTPEQWQHMLDGLQRLILVRNTENRHRLKTSGFRPSAQRPGVLVIIDESHKVVTRETAEQWGFVTREGRSAGVAVWMASQLFSLEAFGGSNAVRSSITAGNTVALRVDPNESSMIKDIPLKPWRLPKIPGMALVDEGRETTIRCAWADQDTTAAMMDTALAGAAQLDTLAARALDQGARGAYTRRHEIAAQANADAEALLATLEADLAPGGPPPGGHPADAVPGGLPSAALAVLTAPNHDPITRGYTGVDAAVLEALANGETRRSTIDAHAQARLGASRSSVHRALTRLRQAGLVDEVAGWGTWRRCDTP